MGGVSGVSSAGVVSVLWKSGKQVEKVYITDTDVKSNFKKELHIAPAKTVLAALHL